MSVSGFGNRLNDVNIPSDYIAHPRESDDLMHLKREIESYVRPEYVTSKYLYTTIVNVKDIKLRKNVGRKRGNDSKVYATVERTMEKGYKVGKLPPVALYNEETESIENWLVNGNHRWMWYSANDYQWMVVDVYEPREGFDEGDVIDEMGLLHQPQPDGTSSTYEDYKTRGSAWVKRQQDKEITVTQDMIDDWVDRIAVNETALTRHNLKKNIFHGEVKDSFLTNYTRSQVVRFFKNCNFTIVDGGAQIKTEVVDRLFEASQKVWLRDFLPTFLENAKQKIKTRLNFYVNTSNVSDGNEISRLISNRISELNEILDNLEVIYDDSKINLRDYLIFGYRPPQVVDTDDYDNLTEIVEEIPTTPTKISNEMMWKMSLSLLQSRFENGEEFSASHAFDIIRPIRSTISKFKSEKSFRGTILRELQMMRDKGFVVFLNDRGTYSLR